LTSAEAIPVSAAETSDIATVTSGAAASPPPVPISKNDTSTVGQ
jgi:hypothetical protein